MRLPDTAESVEGLDSIGQPLAFELAVLVGIVGDLADLLDQGGVGGVDRAAGGSDAPG